MSEFENLIFGVAVGDALGCPVQFFKREQVKSFNITGMVGHGTYDMEAGTWTDDTSMTLAFADSLAHCQKIDYDDIMNRFYAWMCKNEYTPGGKAFDFGRTCVSAVMKHSKGRPALECGGKKEQENGNGSLMRIAPLVFYIREQFGDQAFSSENAELAFETVHNVSRLTHAHPIALLGCDIYMILLSEIISGKKSCHEGDLARSKETLIAGVFSKMKAFLENHPEFSSAFSKYERIFSPDFIHLSEDVIHSTGYVVDTLEAALWCFLNSDSYRECLLKAVNLGGDTDTIGAVAGGIAGLFYKDDEKSAIPREWLAVIQNKELIERIVQGLSERFSPAD